VRVLPQRGVAVSQLTLQDVVEVYQLREELEGFAACLAAERVGPADAEGFAADHGRAVAALAAGEARRAYGHSVLPRRRPQSRRMPSDALIGVHHETGASGAVEAVK